MDGIGTIRPSLCLDFFFFSPNFCCIVCTILTILFYNSSLSCERGYNFLPSPLAPFLLLFFLNTMATWFILFVTFTLFFPLPLRGNYQKCYSSIFELIITKFFYYYYGFESTIHESSNTHNHYLTIVYLCYTRIDIPMWSITLNPFSL